MTDNIKVIVSYRISTIYLGIYFDLLFSYCWLRFKLRNDTYRMSQIYLLIVTEKLTFFFKHIEKIKYIKTLYVTFENSHLWSIIILYYDNFDRPTIFINLV